MNLFCFGFGQVARNFVKKLISENIELKLSFTSRKSKNEIDKSFKGNFFKFDGEFFEKDLIKNLKSADHILISIPPVNREDLVINNFSRYLSQIKPKWITYLSATSVYGNHNGKWVSEKSNLKPSTEFGKSRLKAEKRWLKISKKKNFNLVILRLSGIYSKESNPLMRLKAGSKTFISKKNQFFSRITPTTDILIFPRLSSDNRQSRRLLLFVVDNRLRFIVVSCSKRSWNQSAN